MQEEEQVNVLLVEDDVIDAEAIQRALRKGDKPTPLHVAKDGIEGLEYLRGNAARQPLRRPYLVLLDINMPRMNGFEFMEEIRKDSRLKDTIIFVLTTSASDADKANAYGNNIAGYMVKSKVGRDFSSLSDLLHQYSNIVEFPR